MIKNLAAVIAWLFIAFGWLFIAFGLITGSVAADKPKIGLVVKVGGIPWFNAMEVGLYKQAQKLGWNAVMMAPADTKANSQIEIIEILIAQKVDAIGVVPNDAKALEDVLKKARDRGIYVITHESPQQKNADWNFELASVEGYGEAHAELLAEKMGGKGKYAVFVGSLSVPLHNAWADAAIAHLTKEYPDMKLVKERYGVAENADDSQKIALDLLTSPDEGEGVSGFLTFGSQGSIGVGRAVEEQGKVGEISVVGSVSPRQGMGLLLNDVISGGFMWNPQQAGQVFVTLADILRKAYPIEAGSLIEGLGRINPKGNNIIVDQLVNINKKTVSRLANMGL